MTACFGRVDAEVLSGGIVCRNDCITHEGNNESSCGQRITSEAVGTTAVVAIIGSSQIVVTNCGDSRAILSRGDRPVVLSQDHKPDRQDEMEQIKAAGGRVFFYNGPRVLGVLAMSRAIAAVAWGVGEPLKIEEVELAPPKAMEVRIKVHYTTLCHTDIYFWEAKGQTPLFPRILGHEAARVVESVGEGVSDLKEGDSVLPIFTGEWRMQTLQVKGEQHV